MTQECAPTDVSFVNPSGMVLAYSPQNRSSQEREALWDSLVVDALQHNLEPMHDEPDFVNQDGTQFFLLGEIR